MKAYLYVGDIKVGEVDLSVIDESMGAVGGYLLTNPNYKKYQSRIRQQYELQGISNVNDLDFRLLLYDETTTIDPSGGIGVTDSEDLDEIYVEAAGLDLAAISNWERYR